MESLLTKVLGLGWHNYLTMIFLLCGASLVCTNWVITAAHCFLDPAENTLNLEPTRYRVMLGRNFRKYTVDERGSQSFIPARIFSHPEYSPAMNLHDVAMIGLPKAVRISDYVRPICLPSLAKKINDDLSRIVELNSNNVEGLAKNRKRKGQKNEDGEAANTWARRK